MKSITASSTTATPNGSPSADDFYKCTAQKSSVLQEESFWAYPISVVTFENVDTAVNAVQVQPHPPRLKSKCWFQHGPQNLTTTKRSRTAKIRRVKSSQASRSNRTSLNSNVKLMAFSMALISAVVSTLEWPAWAPSSGTTKYNSKQRQVCL